MPEFGPERGVEHPKSLYFQLADEANLLYAAYKDLPWHDFNKKRGKTSGIA